MDSNIINDLFNFLVIHYMESKAEEKLMRRFNYSFIETHLQEHRRLIENFTALKEDAEKGISGPLYLSFRTQLLLFDWFSGHIAKADRHMGRFIIAESFIKPKSCL